MKKCLSAVALAFTAATIVTGGAQAQSALSEPLIKTKYYLGSLNCNVSGSAGLIFGSSKDLTCVFVTTTGQSETYTGSNSGLNFAGGVAELSLMPASQ